MVIDSIIYVPKMGEEDGEQVVRSVDALRWVAERHNLPLLKIGEVSSHLKSPLCVSLGGDGTMLTTIRLASSFPDATVLGTNYGKLGFLADYYTPELVGWDVHDLIEDGENWKRDRRMLVQADTPNTVAVNEFLVTTPSRKTPLTYNIFINDLHVAEQSGDGVIIATATGSTGYAMSAGGAIMSPTSRAIQIVPLAAHTLSSRPVMVSEDDVVRVEAKLIPRIEGVTLFADGILVREHITPNTTFIVEIRKDGFVDVWRKRDWNFFEVLSQKLGWSK